MAEEQKAESIGQRSSFSHFMLESERIVRLKSLFEEQMKFNFGEQMNREDIINTAETMSAEIDPLCAQEEKLGFVDLLSKMPKLSSSLVIISTFIETHSSDAVALGQYQNTMDAFKLSLRDFLKYFIRMQDRAELQFKKMKEQGEMVKYLKACEVNKRGFMNGRRIWISPQLEFFCRGLFLRVKYNFDNVIIIDAKRGRGKSTLAVAIATTVAAMCNAEFTIDKNLFFDETREQCQKVIAGLPPYSPVIFDQAGNQVNANTRFEDDQINLLNQLDIERFRNHTMIFNWHEAQALDKDVRERIATHIITIEKKGLATVKTFNLNPANKGITHNPKYKNAVAATPEQAMAIGDMDSLKLFDIPFYNMEFDNTPEAMELWKVYTEQKSKAHKRGRKIKADNTGLDFLYEDFLAGLEPGVVRISSEALEAYGVQKSTNLSMTALVKKLGRATNQKPVQIYVNTDQLNPNEGFINVDKYITTYIDRLRSRKLGAAQYAKEREANGQ